MRSGDALCDALARGNQLKPKEQQKFVADARAAASLAGAHWQVCKTNDLFTRATLIALSRQYVAFGACPLFDSAGNVVLSDQVRSVVSCLLEFLLIKVLCFRNSGPSNCVALK